MKIAILGTQDACQRAPFGQPDWQMWGLNDGYLKLPAGTRADLWFEVHGENPITRVRREPDHWQNLAELDIPVYTFHELPSVPKARHFDIAPLVQIRDYFACTNAYQIAYAITLGATAIGLWGISLMTAREALIERPCVEWWLGYAQGKGIEVVIEHDYRYGLGRQSFRYAIDDREEREDSYVFVKNHHHYTTDWLTRENDLLVWTKTT